MEELIREQKRLAQSATDASNAVRRKWTFTGKVVASFVALALAPLIPKSEHLFGKLTVGQAASVSMVAIFFVTMNTWIYKKNGGTSFVYTWFESFEAFCLYGSILAYIYYGNTVFSPLWVSRPLTAVFWGGMRPFDIKRYSLCMFVPHVLLAMGWWSRGWTIEAYGALIVGAVIVSIFIFHAKTSRRLVFLQAKKNVTQAKLNIVLLDMERKKIEDDLRLGLGRDITHIIADLKKLAPTQDWIPILLDQAERALHEVGVVTHEIEDSTTPLSASLSELKDKCMTLCEILSINQEDPVSTADCFLQKSRARALLHVVQELVRNAVVHGHATQVDIEVSCQKELKLRIRDNGIGLSENVLQEATGGLRNAQDWMREASGSLVQKLGLDHGAEFALTLPIEQLDSCAVSE